MKEEVLRLDRVRYSEQGAVELNHFSLQLFAGEIMGLVPVNGMGLRALMRLLTHNLPLHYGFVYYREKLVNHWRHAGGGANRIRVIDSRTGLADDLTVAENVFVLRPGFRKQILHRETLRRQLQPFLAEIDVNISAEAYAKDLSSFQRVIVELVKAVVAGCRLVVLTDMGTLLSETELARLHAILRQYAGRGMAFLYISQHYEEIQQVCGRAALMINGQITKVLNTAETTSRAIYRYSAEWSESILRTQESKRAPERQGVAALTVQNLWRGVIAGLTLAVAPGECVVLQDLDNRIFDTLLAILMGTEKPDCGYIQVEGKRLDGAIRREIAVVQQLADRSMLFPDLSYLDNLCFMMDHRLPRVWRHARSRESIRREYEPILGREVFDKRLDELTQAERYDLIYARVLLQRPKAAVCVQPFMQADVEQRMHIWSLLERLLSKGIAVVILAVNLADSLSLADRLIRVQGGRVQATHLRSEFGELPDSVPWQYLWE